MVVHSGMAYLPVDADGWCVWKAIETGTNRCKFVYVDEDLPPNAPPGVVYSWGDAAIGSDPVNNPTNAIRPFRYAIDATTAMHAHNGLSFHGQQFALLYKRGSVFRGRPAPTTTEPPGANVRGIDPTGPWHFEGPSDQYPILIGAYGPLTKDRPILDIYEGDAVLLSYGGTGPMTNNPGNTSNVMIQSLHFRAPRRNPLSPEYDQRLYDKEYQLLQEADTNESRDAVRASSHGPLRLDVRGVQGQLTNRGTHLEKRCDNITIEDCLFQYLCAGIGISVGGDPITPPNTGDVGPRSEYWFINRCAFDRLYCIPRLPGQAVGGRTNSITIYNINYCRVRGIRQQYVGWIPEDFIETGGRSERNEQSQGVYCGNHTADFWEVDGFMASKGCFSCLQVRGGKGVKIKNVVASNHARALDIGHNQNNYDVEGQQGGGTMSDPVQPRFMEFTIQNILIEAPDRNTPNDDAPPTGGNVGNGVSIRRVHKLTLENMLLHRGDQGTSTSEMNAFVIGQVGKPFNGVAHTCAINYVTIDRWTNTFAGRK